MSQIDRDPAGPMGGSLTDEQKAKLKDLAWRALSRFMVAGAARLGAGLVKAALDAILKGRRPEDDDEVPDPDDDEDDEEESACRDRGDA